MVRLVAISLLVLLSEGCAKVPKSELPLWSPYDSYSETVEPVFVPYRIFLHPGMMELGLDLG